MHQVADDALPKEWRQAYEQDQRQPPLAADPLPERLAARALAAFIVTGLTFLALPGTFLGVWNLISIAQHHAASAASIAWIQAHGHAQLFGWVGTFILGISLYVLPKIQGRSPRQFGKFWIIWALWTAGVSLRWWAGVGAQQWRETLVVSGILEGLACAFVFQVLVFSRGRSEATVPQDMGSWMGIVGLASLGLALILNLGIAIQVARTARLPAYPAAADRTFLLIALWGFVVPFAWGYSTRFVTIFLGLAPPLHRAGRWLAAGIGIVVVLALLKRFLIVDSLALLLTLLAVWVLRVFHPSARPAKLLGAYSRYPAFVRLAYLWLIVGAALGFVADLVPSASGLGGASRHAVTVGFVATLIFAVGPRLLPSFLNGRVLHSPSLMGTSLWLLNLGCLVRVASESVAYSAGGWAWKALPASALLELAAVVVFVTNLGLTLAQPVLAWFSPEAVNANLPLYWYVSSFPKTRKVMVRAGLETLGRVKDVPRSLTLREAAQADGVEVEAVLSHLRDFFSRRQPRRHS